MRGIGEPGVDEDGGEKLCGGDGEDNSGSGDGSCGEAWRREKLGRSLAAGGRRSRAGEDVGRGGRPARRRERCCELAAPARKETLARTGFGGG